MRKLSASLCSALLVLLGMGALTTLTSCGSSQATVQQNPPTVSIAANPTTIMQGGSSTLTVTATNATQVVITDSTDGNKIDMSGAGGTQPVTPAATVTYTATATGAGGTATATVTVTVTPVAVPPTVAVTANPPTITQGSSSLLTVTASNATQVVITDNTDAKTYLLTGTGGNVSVTPATTTTYTATATGTNGTATATATATITVTPVAVPPTVALTANPPTIMQGSSSLLTVTASNATQVVITDNTDAKTYLLSGTGGNVSVTPAATTTYTATATGTNGTTTATATATVTVTPVTGAPTVAISAQPTTIALGGSSVLTVTATNATQVVITDNTDTTTYSLSATGGTQPVSPTTTTTYTATATGAGGTTTAMAIVTVSPPPTVTIVANPTTVAAGNSSVLTVSATNATQVVITDNIDSSSYVLPGTGGTQPVTPASTTTYTATATGAGGKAVASVTVTVTAAGPTVTISANPTTIASGASSTLTVTATNASQVVISNNVDSSTIPVPATGGSVPVTPASTRTYTVTATSAGGATAKASVVVGVLPSVKEFVSPTSIMLGNSSTLTVTATNATQVTISNNVDSTTYTLGATGGTQPVSPTTTTTYTATATSSVGTTTATATVTVHAQGADNAVNHVIFMLQENRSFDTYFGMLNPYRQANSLNVGDDGKTYNVDGIDDKLSTTANLDDQGTSYSLFHTQSSCLDDMTSSWIESYGDVNRYDFATTRPILMDGFVHTAEAFANNNAAGGAGSPEGSFTDLTGQRAMAYYRDTSVSNGPELNYYYYMASQFALSDRWFSPISSKSTPNRLATLTGGTTQGLVHDPFVDDKLTNALSIETIFQELDKATPAVTWKIYYSLTEGGCDVGDGDCGNKTNPSLFPVTSFSDFGYSTKYLYNNPSQAACTPPTVGSSAVGDTSNSFCIDPTHVAPLSQFITDANNGSLPSFSYVEPAFGVNDEHPGSGQSIFSGQARIAYILNNFMTSKSWADSVFFLSYDEGGGPYDHVPPVPGHSNDNTDSALGSTPDIASIAVNPDTFPPCAANPATLHCDLSSQDPGATSPNDAPAVYGFAAQLGFRLPNMVISPFTRKHFVSHEPMDHTAIIKFVESRFIGSSAHLTNRDAAQPDLLDFFDFTNVPWKIPPTGMPTPPAAGSTCTPANM